jgi:ubiquinone/menaquinone biosynthesis C-methylase UbiE
VRDADDLSSVPSREADFYDRLVAGRDPLEAPPTEPDLWEAAILDAAGPLAGATVLDYGCGDGTLTLHVAQAGAGDVTGVDISPASIEFARRRVEAYAPEANVKLFAADAVATGLPSETFDVIVGKFVLHHLELDAALAEIKRLLRPGGRAAFIETSGINPILSIARRHVAHADRFNVAKLGTSDEHPLVLRDFRLVRRIFPGARIDFPLFWFWRVYNRSVLRYRSADWSRRLNRWDQFVERRARLLGPMSYYVRITVTRDA